MARPSSTIVVVGGSVPPAVLPALDRLPNVRAASLSGDEAPPARELIARSSLAYLVHDADPLAAVAKAWAAYFDDGAPYGTVEVAVEAALASLRRGDALLPDYFLVLDAAELPQIERHWWFGVLATASPGRVIPVEPDAASVQRALSRLPDGRWWPDPPEEWLRGLGRAVPDRVGLGLGDAGLGDAGLGDGGARRCGKLNSGNQFTTVNRPPDRPPARPPPLMTTPSSPPQPPLRGAP
ncbi:hypothetical protein [Compostimonas suwonensis]|uniref:Uncharacterized protein n=1 Tax=Compostimonas suwonensis TaxID=1048394 RepID=A0A2M9BB41_9MICO|nr:hypothetical protein [Compostimonas suwonensis]PJJ55147.1 hypothetical protein CLV54_3487 [Compostimonas suwonensis]